jgi:hypothetical protein
MSDFTNFRAVYDELTDEVTRARYQFLTDHLKRWFGLLDDTPAVVLIVSRLQSDLDFEDWYKQQESTVKSMVGSGRLQYPSDAEKSLGMRLLLFREFAEGRMEAWRFATNFVYSTNNLNDLSRGVVEQIFEPMARELRRLLEYELQNGIPAADRIVKLNHNSVSYKEAMTALDTLKEFLRQSNDFPNAEEKEQALAEVAATKTLLEAAQVRLVSVLTVLRPAVKYVARTFANTVLSKTAALAWELIVKLFV